jgi:hypothetical protein
MSEELPCRHRSPEPVGQISCGCGGKRNAYRCDHPAVLQLVTRHVAQPRRKDVRLFEPGPDGRRVVKLARLSLPACVTCPHRPEALPAVVEMFGAGPDPSGPAAAPDCLRATICGGCPRIGPAGQGFECLGPEVPACPLQLWPTITRTRRGTTRRGCQGCG